MSSRDEQDKEKLFHFKQFSLSDSGCAMKIGTDGVILGAFAAKFADINQPHSILDIGTGCGLIALMTAQKSVGVIHAIDTDKKAVETASRNFCNSPWADRLKVFYASLQEFGFSSHDKYNMIVCNPPYFQNSLKSPDMARNLARHNQELSFEDLFLHSARLLSNDGRLLVIYPVENMDLVKSQSAKQGFAEAGRLWISPDAGAPPKRIISEFCLSGCSGTETEYLHIETGVRHNFSEAYRQLTFDYHPFFNNDSQL
ncbi:MAG: methyltransferase domain-containing protein [Bacteroidetes bacterium]|nr:MAG: methyltransferase domain-containing protein [Bacteroidota bacterium]